MPNDSIKGEKYVEGSQPFDEFTKQKDQIVVGLRRMLILIFHQ